MIKWTDIDNEVEEFQNGYKSGFVAIFKKYEGMETDDKDASNRTVKVTRASFAKRYGIAETTFRGWLDAEVGTTAASTSSRGTINDRMAEAAAKATAEAEAKAAKSLADALAKQDREAKAAEAKRAKEAAAKIRAEEQAKAAEATRKQREADAKKIAELERSLTAAAKKAEFDMSTMSEAQKAQVMTMLANDPEKAAEWFKAQTAERSRKLADAEKKAKAEAERKKSQMAERESRKAAERAKQDYDSSALKKFIAVADMAEKMLKLLNDKPITFDHILASGLSAQEWVHMTELVEDMAVEVREAIFAVNAAQELSDITE